MERCLAILAWVALASCATTRSYDEADVSRFRVGVTTRGDAERVLGPPRYTSDLGDGRFKLVWNVGQEGQASAAASAKLVTLVFAADGRLAQPPVTSFASGPVDRSRDEVRAQPAGRLPRACATNADCTGGGLCLNGVCRD